MAACSQSSGNDGGPNDGVGNDAVDAVDTTPADVPPEASPNTPYLSGTVEITQVAIPLGAAHFYQATEHASFLNVPPDAGVVLDTRTDGPCQITHVDTTAASPGLMVDVSAGNVTISGGMGTDIVLTPQADGHYMDNTMMNMNRWMGGDMISVMAAGANVPAFTSMVTVPPLITVTSPAMPSPPTAHIVINRTGFPAQWMSTGSGTVGVVIAQSAAGSPSGTEIFCLYPFGDGMGTVPATSLMDLQPGVSTFVVIGATNTTTTMAGMYPVRISASNVTFAAQADVR